MRPALSPRLASGRVCKEGRGGGCTIRRSFIAATNFFFLCRLYIFHLQVVNLACEFFDCEVMLHL